jgi:hypothetical protein
LEVKGMSLGDYVKGVFCLEGEWTRNLRQPSSLEPILQLLRNRDQHFRYIHRFVISRAELEVYLRKWTQSRYADHPVLYLACHGQKGNFFFSSSARVPGVSLDDLEELLSGRCKGRVICLGACGSLDQEGRRVERFLGETGALAVCGYRGDVDWMTSTAFELMLLAMLQQNASTVGGMRAVKRRLRSEAATRVRNLGFHMAIREARRSTTGG